MTRYAIDVGGAYPTCVESKAMASDAIDDATSGRGAKDGVRSQTTENTPKPGSENITGEPVPGTSPTDTSHKPVAEQVDDAELVEILERLSETIDTAQTVLTEQHNLASEAGQTKHYWRAPDASHVANILTQEPPVLASALVQTNRRGFVWFLATCTSVILSIGALVALWIFWNTPETTSKLLISNDRSRVGEPILSHSSSASLDKPVPLDPAERKRVQKELMTQFSSSAGRIPPDRPRQSKPTQVPTNLELVPPKSDHSPLELQSDTPPPQQVARDEPRPVSEGAEENASTQPQLPLGNVEAEKILLRGKQLSESGDISAARLVFEYAAQRRSADAMFALGETYDPEKLATWRVMGIQPDLDAALNWYNRAAAFGHESADVRVHELRQIFER